MIELVFGSIDQAFRPGYNLFQSLCSNLDPHRTSDAVMTYIIGLDTGISHYWRCEQCPYLRDNRSIDGAKHHCVPSLELSIHQHYIDGRPKAINPFEFQHNALYKIGVH